MEARLADFATMVRLPNVPPGQTIDMASSEDDILRLVKAKHEEGGRHLIICWTTTFQDRERRGAFEKRVIDKISVLNGRARRQRQRLPSFVDARKIEEISNEKSGIEAEQAYVECFKGCARSNPIVPVVGLRLVLENDTAFRAFLGLSKDYLSGDFNGRSNRSDSFVIVGFVDRINTDFREKLETIGDFFDDVAKYPEIFNLFFTPPIEKLAKRIRENFSDILNDDNIHLEGRLLDLVDAITSSAELALLPKNVLGETLSENEARVERLLERAAKGLPPARPYFPDEWKDSGGPAAFLQDVYGDLLNTSDPESNFLYQDQLQKLHPSKAGLRELGDALGLEGLEARYGTAAWGYDLLKALKNAGGATPHIPPKAARYKKLKQRATNAGLTDAGIRARRSAYTTMLK